MELNTKARAFKGLSFAVALSMLSACASTRPEITEPSGASASTASLDHWVSAELVPYLQSKMVDHPRFKSEPVAIVKLTDLSVDPQIDALTARMRKDLESQLIKEGGISLIWQQAGAKKCQPTEQAHYFLGLDTSVEDGELNVNVRMLDVRENAWVPQFSYSYRGPSNKRINALANKQVDDAWIQGSRVAPFPRADADLAAKSLAQRFSCEVERFSGKSSVYLEPSEEGNVDAYERMQVLLKNYLQQQDNLTIVDQPDNADFNLRAELVWVDNSLTQLWVKPVGKERSHLPNSVHVYLDNPMRDELASPGPVAAPNNQSSAVEPMATNNTRPLVIDSFKVSVPADRSLCTSSTPWSQGRIALADKAMLPSGTCFALDYSLNQAGYVYLVHEGPNGQLSRLKPNNCDLASHSLVQARTNISFPGQNQIIDLDDETGAETFHLLAVADKVASEQVRDSLDSLPTPFKQCAAPKGIVVRPLTAGQLIERLKSDTQHVDWQTRTISHQ